MPEGPSIVILREKPEHFSGKKIIAASGDATIDFAEKGKARGSLIIARIARGSTRKIKIPAALQMLRSCSTSAFV